MFIAIYFVTFAAGPLAFWALARQKPNRSYFTQLAVLAVVLLVIAVVLPRSVGEDWVTWVYFGVVLLTILWLAWIAVLAMCALAVRRRYGNGRAFRGAFAIGAVATTLPWFGLNLAQLMAN